MENNNKSTNIFLGVIGVATLIVAIIGATFAFFGAETTGGNETLKASSTKLDLSFEDDLGHNLKTDMIPAETWIAEYAAMTQLSQAEIDAKKASDEDYEYPYKNLQCEDDNGNDVCGVYTFQIANPSNTTTQTLYATLNVVSNEFTDLYFRIYDENNKEVVGPTNIPKTGAVNLTGLTQTLLASTKSAGYENEVPKPSTFEIESGTETKEVVADSVTPTDKQIKLTDAKRINPDAVVGGNVTINTYNKRKYKMVIWIEENWTDQTDDNSGKSFAGSLVFTTANDSTGVTGVIAAAQKGTNPDNPTSPGFGADIDTSGGQETPGNEG